MPPFIKCKSNDKCIAEVLKVKVIGSEDILLNPVEILKHASTKTTVYCQNGRKALNTNAIAKREQVLLNNLFEPPIYQYKKLKEKMVIEIEVKVVANKHLGIFATDLDN